MQYRNFVFDLGNTLFDEKRDEKGCAATLAPFKIAAKDEAQYQMLLSNLMLGTISVKQVKGMLIAQDAINEEILADVDTIPFYRRNLPALARSVYVPFMARDERYRVFILSNASDAMRDYAKWYFKTEKCNIGYVFSCDVGMMKPDIRIYKELLKKYALKADETIFFDDMPKNCCAAEMCGIKSVLVKPLSGHDELLEYLS